jgi:hypothetical protein
MNFNIPYGDAWAMAKHVGRFVKPATGHMIAGAVVGGATGAMGGNGNTVRDTILGAGAGLAGSGMGRSYFRSGMGAARAEKGVFNIGAGASGIRGRITNRWRRT